MAEEAVRVGHQDVPRGARLRLVMQLRGVSVPKLSNATGISEGQIYRYLRLDLPGVGGKSADPSGDNLRLISEALDVHPGYLISAYHWPDKLSSSDSDTPGYRNPVGRSAHTRRVKVPEFVGSVAVG